MNARVRKIPVVLLTFVMALGCWLMFSQRSGMETAQATVSYANAKGYWSSEEIRAAGRAEEEQEAPLLFAAWGQKNNQIIESEELGREVTAPVIQMEGPVDLLFFGGRKLDAEDADGCLVGKETAEKLFGSSRAVGQFILYEGKKYEIRGVLTDMSRGVIVPCIDETDAALNRITIRKPEGAGTGWRGDAFLVRTGLAAEEIDYRLITDAAAMLRGVLPLLMLAFILVFLTKWFLEDTGKWPERLMILALGALCVWIYIRFFFVIPETLQTYLPGQWADLDYFGDFIKEKTEAVQNLLTMNRTAIDEVLSTNLRLTAFGTALGILGFLFGLHKLNPGKYIRRILELYPDNSDK